MNAAIEAEPMHRADGARRVVDAGAGTRLARREVARGGRRERTPHAGVADAHEGGRQQEHPDRGVDVHERRVPDERRPATEAAGPERAGTAGRCDRAACPANGARTPEQHGHRDEQERGLRRREAARELDEEHQRQRHARHREADRGDRDVRDREVALAEQLERDERLALGPRLLPDEEPEHERRRR